MTRGPTGPEGGVETEDNPTPQDVLETVEWAVTTERVEMAKFHFLDGGGVSEYIELTPPGTVYNLYRLTGNRVETTQRILEDWVINKDGLQPKEDATNPYIITEVDASVEQHKRLFETLLSDVYESSLDEIQKLERSASAAPASDQSLITEIATDPQRVYDMLRDQEIKTARGEIGGYTLLNDELAVDALSVGLGLEDITHEPSKFPGLVYRPNLSPTAVLFETGHVTVVGASDEDAVQAAIDQVVSRITRLDIHEIEQPDPSEIRISELQ